MSMSRYAGRSTHGSISLPIITSLSRSPSPSKTSTVERHAVMSPDEDPLFQLPVSPMGLINRASQPRDMTAANSSPLRGSSRVATFVPVSKPSPKILAPRKLAQDFEEPQHAAAATEPLLLHQQQHQDVEEALPVANHVNKSSPSDHKELLLSPARVIASATGSPSKATPSRSSARTPPPTRPPPPTPSPNDVVPTKTSPFKSSSSGNPPNSASSPELDLASPSQPAVFVPLISPLLSGGNTMT